MTQIIPADQALAELLGTECKGCGGHKPPRMSHCRRCYFSLAKPMRAALYREIGNGYEAVYAESLEILKKRKGAT